MDGMFNLARVFGTIAEALGDQDCVVIGKQRRSYREVADRAIRLAVYLHSRGLGIKTERADLAGYQSSQDHLALALWNGSEYLEGMVGAYAARVAPFNVNYRYVGEELQYLLQDAAPAGVMFHASYAPVLAPVLESLPPMAVLLQVADESGNPLLPGAVDYEEAIASVPSAAPRVEPSGDDLYLLYTGGTTGMPKGVLWRQHDIFLAAMGGRSLGTWEEVDSYEKVAARALDKRGLSVLMLPPLMHGAAQWSTFMGIGAGATIIFPPDPRHLDPRDVLGTIEREQVNVVILVGDATLRPLLDEFERESYDLSSVGGVANGGAVLSTPLRDRLHRLLPQAVIADAAGSSETGAQMMQTSAGEAGSAGLFVPGPGTVVVSESFSHVLSPGDKHLGWLAQSGYIPLGYLNDPVKTASTFPEINGIRYSIPGDRARVLDDGRIELLGRDAATINSGGEKIFAEEVESAIAGHPAVMDVVVTGRDSDRWGQEVIAIVALRRDVSATFDEIVQHASSFIARYKLPKDVVFVDSVQRSPSGKADYQWAKEQARQGGTV